MGSVQTPSENSCQSSRPALISNLKGLSPAPDSPQQIQISPDAASSITGIISTENCNESHFPTVFVTPGPASLSSLTAFTPKKKMLLLYVYSKRLSCDFKGATCHFNTIAKSFSYFLFSIISNISLKTML